MGIGIPWQTSDPSAYARAARSQRDLAAITGIVKGGAGLVKGAVKQGQTEEAENDEIVRLRAALGMQEQKAVDQSEHPGQPAFTQTDLDTGETHTIRPAEEESPVDRGLRSLGTFSRRAAVGAGFLPDTGGAGRRRDLARLRGQVGLQTFRGKLLGSLSKAIAGSSAPGAAVGKLAPESGLGPGDLAPRPGAAHAGRAPNEWEMRERAAEGDPSAKAAVTGHQADALERAKAGSAWMDKYLNPQPADHPESDQSGAAAEADPDAQGTSDRIRQMLGNAPTEADVPPGTPHPTREHAAQRKAAVLRSARGIELTTP